MALVKFDRGLFTNGNSAKGLNYGQIEPNQVWFDRAGMVEAQCKLDTDDFSDAQVAPNVVGGKTGTAAATNKIVAEVGAFLQIDKATYTASVPTKAGKTAGMPVGVNYSSEKLYNQFAPQRRNFFLTTNDWLPRIGYVERGMRITTNTVMFDDTTYAPTEASSASKVAFDTIQAAIGTGQVVYAAVRDGSDGELILGITPDATEDIILAQVVAAYTNADRTCSFMFQILDGGTK